MPSDLDGASTPKASAKMQTAFFKQGRGAATPTRRARSPADFVHRGTDRCLTTT
jgi:hypothetical protein